MPTATELDYFLFSGVGGIVDENEMKLTGPRNGAFPRQLSCQEMEKAPGGGNRTPS